MKNNYPLYYHLPWPDCQKYEEMPGFTKNAILDTSDYTYGYFIDKEWLDKIED